MTAFAHRALIVVAVATLFSICAALPAPETADSVVPEEELLTAGHDGERVAWGLMHPNIKVADSIVGHVDDSEDVGTVGLDKSHTRWDPAQARWRVRSPGYVSDDASLTPDETGVAEFGKYNLGGGRRRIGAGFGRRRAPVAIPGAKHVPDPIEDIDKAMGEHPDIAARVEAMKPSAPGPTPPTPLTDDEMKELYREIVGLKDGPTFYTECNFKGDKTQSPNSHESLTHASTGSIHIPKGWCVKLFSEKDFGGKSIQFCHKDGDQACLNQYGYEKEYVSSLHTAADIVGHQRTRHNSWMHPKSVKVWSYYYTQSDPPECSAPHAGTSVEGKIACDRRHGLEPHGPATLEECAESGLTMPAPLTRECPAPPPAKDALIRFTTGPLSSKPSAERFVHEVTKATHWATTSPDSPPKGFCTKEGSLAEVANKIACSGTSRNIAFKYDVEFTVTPADAGEWHFDFNVDFGWGGIVYFDGKPSSEGYQSADHWWSGHYDRALPLDIAHTFDAGRHTMTVYGGEGCCDGSSHVSFRKPGQTKAEATIVTAEALAAPEVVGK